MKNLFVFTLLFLFLAGTYSCQKDTAITNKEEAQKIGTQVYPTVENLTYQAELESHHIEKSEIRATIEDFFGETQFRNTMTVSEGVWTVETGLNYLQGNARASYKVLSRNDYHYFLASTQNTQLSSSEVDNVITSIESQVIADKNALIASCGNGKSIYVNITPFTNDSGEVIIKATIGTGTNADPVCVQGQQLIPSLDNCSFTNQTGEWKWEDYVEFECQNGNGTATKAIQALLNYNDENWPCPLTNADEDGGFFSEIQLSGELYYENYPNPDDDQLDGFQDYLLFQIDNELEYCFSPEDMTFYYNGAKTIINQELNTDPNLLGKEFVSVTRLEGDCTFFSGDNPSCSHFMRFEGGIYME